jgi:hypothetical protein
MRSLLLTMLILAPAGAATFTFETTPYSTRTPLSITDSGLVADFSSPDVISFFVSNSFFSTLTGNILLDVDPATHQLDILFSQAVSSISLRFALNGDATSSLQLAAFSGATSRGTASATGSIPDGFFFPEGTISFANALGFNALRLTSTGEDFAIDDLNATVRASQVVPDIGAPEPVSTGLVFFGLAALVARRRMHRC